MRHLKSINEVNNYSELKKFFIEEDEGYIWLWEFVEHLWDRKIDYTIAQIKYAYDKKETEIQKLMWKKSSYLPPVDQLNIIYQSDNLDDAYNMLELIINSRKYNL